MQKATMRFLPKSISIIALGLITAFTSYKAAAVDVVTDPVGFWKLPIANTPVAGSAYTIVGLPLQQIRADGGLVSAVTSNVLTVACSTCATSNYGLATAPHYVRLATGAGQGRYFAISTNTATTLTLVIPGESLLALGSGGAVASNDQYRINPFWTLKTVFGLPPNTPLQQNAKVGSADNVLIYNGTTFDTYFPNTTAWIKSVGAVNSDNLPLAPDEGVFVLRRNVNATNIFLAGEVQVVKTNVSPLQSGFNYVCNAFPSGTVLSNANLTAAGSSWVSNAKVGTADNLLVFNTVTGSYDTYFHNGTQWIKSVGAVPSNGFSLDAPVGYVLQLKHPAGGYWKKPIPYTP